MSEHIANTTKLTVPTFNIKNYGKITKEQYEFALNRIEELLPLVTDETPANDKNAIELTLMSDIVESYEKRHFPIGKPSVSELIELTGRSEPTLKIARLLCKVLNITPAAMLQY